MLLGLSLAAAAGSVARAETVEQMPAVSQLQGASPTVEQVTSVSQLSDVKPSDWAFQALQSLVERYGCIAGYPDKTYRGNRALTRFEFAAGLNACMDRVNELISAATADAVKREDLEALRKLQEEFAAELATLRGRVDALEARTSTLEKQQFSTTTKLAGEVIFAVTDEFNTAGNNTVFQDRVRLSLNTSFTGKDRLVTRLSAGNAGTFTIPTDRFLGPGIDTATSGYESTQTFNLGNTGSNSVNADWVAYYGALGENIQFYMPAIGGLHYDYAQTYSPALDSGDSGTTTLSTFAQRNPIYAIGGGSGIGIGTKVSGFDVAVGYLANNANSGGAANNVGSAAFGGGGLFSGSYSALAQVGFNGEKFGLGLTYINAFKSDGDDIFDGGGSVGFMGTELANFSTSAQDARVNAYGASAFFKLSPQIVLNGHFAYVDVDYINDTFGSGEVWTYGLGLAFPDLGKKGNLAGITFGAQPYLGNPTQLGNPFSSNDTPFHAEGFYKYQVTNNISVTPGVIWIMNPGQTNNNNDVVIGTLRTTFTF
jgi:hypothetical protein